MWIGRIECGAFVRRPGFAATDRWIGGRPVLDGLLVIAKYVEDGSVLDENHLEGWSVARHLVVQHFEMPLTQEFLQLWLKIWGK